MPAKDKEVFIVVPARKNSKRLKNKNIKDFEGFPLFEWSLAAAIFVKKTLKSFLQIAYPASAYVRAPGATTEDPSRVLLYKPVSPGASSER